MFKSFAISLIITLFFFVAVTAQNPQVDSLVRVLNKSAADTNKVNLYWKIGVSIINHDAPAAIPYVKNGAALATKLGFISGMERCTNVTSVAFFYHGKYDSALFYSNAAIPYAIKAGNIRRLPLAYLNRADVFANLQNFSAALKDCDTAIIYAEKTKSSDGLGRIYSIMSEISFKQNQYLTTVASLDKSDQFFL